MTNDEGQMTNGCLMPNDEWAPRTLVAECRVQSAECGSAREVGTLGTGFQYPRAYADELVDDDLFIGKLIGCEEPVPTVPTVPKEKDERDLRDEKDAGSRLSYLTSSGDLVIPFDSAERYRWWKGGQGRPRESARGPVVARRLWRGWLAHSTTWRTSG